MKVFHLFFFYLFVSVLSVPAQAADDFSLIIGEFNNSARRLFLQMQVIEKLAPQCSVFGGTLASRAQGARIGLQQNVLEANDVLQRLFRQTASPTSTAYGTNACEGALVGGVADLMKEITALGHARLLLENAVGLKFKDAQEQLVLNDARIRSMLEHTQNCPVDALQAYIDSNKEFAKIKSAYDTIQRHLAETRS